jgi:hypothetical protein
MGEKCHFAHGDEELRTANDVITLYLHLLHSLLMNNNENTLLRSKYNSKNLCREETTMVNSLNTILSSSSNINLMEETSCQI